MTAPVISWVPDFPKNARTLLDVIHRHLDQARSALRYFFRQPTFAYCSWPYVSGDGPLNLGIILMGYERGILTAPCSACSSRVIVSSFGGSVLSGSNKWSGTCPACRLSQSGRWNEFSQRVIFVCEMRKEFFDGAIGKNNEECVLKEYNRKRNFPSGSLQEISSEVPVGLAQLVQEFRSS